VGCDLHFSINLCSGNGVSRGGRGPYGAGNVDQEAQDAEKNPAAVLEENAEEGAQVTEEATPVVEVVDNTVSYDEFLRKRQEARSTSAILAATKASRAVETQIAGLKASDERAETYIAPKNVKTVQDAKREQRSTGKTQVVDVAFKFESTAVPEFRKRDESRGDSRGGRGGDRRPKSATAPAAPKKAAGSALSSSDFPSL
jgi:hypothetical protein